MRKIIFPILLIVYAVFDLHAAMSGAGEYLFRDADINTAKTENGEYFGTAVDHEGAPLRVKVVVKDHSIREIEIIESKEDGYIFMASGLIPLIIELQSVEVDAVSGATVSSDALIRAIKDALS